MKKLITNCPNCGAPLQDGYCSYCNTKVRYANELEFDSIANGGYFYEILPTEILLKCKNQDGTLLVVPFVGKPQNVEIEYNTTDIVSRDCIVKTFYTAAPTIRFEMVGHLKNDLLYK